MSGEITIPSTLGGYPVTTIGYAAFDGCNKLTGIKLPDSIVWIEEAAFTHCSGLKTITIPSSVSYISYAAFRGCSSLTSVTMCEGLTTISSSAFESCSQLTTVTIPVSVDYIATLDDNGAFAGCNSITSATIPGKFAISNIFPSPTAIKQLTVSPGSSSVCDGFAEGLSSLTSITIPTSVTTIGHNAFWGCTCLGSGIVTVNGNCMFPVSDSNESSLKIGTQVVFVAEDTWAHVQNMNSIDVGTGNAAYLIRDGFLFSYDESVFVASPKTIKDVGIPSTVSKISDYAFYGCSSIESMTIPAGVKSIGANSFTGCTGIKKIGSSCMTVGIRSRHNLI